MFASAYWTVRLELCSWVGQVSDWPTEANVTLTLDPTLGDR